MDADVLRCPSCGAAIVEGQPICPHCGSRVATVSCPSCFGLISLDARFCRHCGSPAVKWRPSASDLRCPCCDEVLLEGALRDYRLHECGRCFGIWLDPQTFGLLCRDAERGSLHQPGEGMGSAGRASLGPVRYHRCPVCQDIMGRVNFANCSGVVVDVCRNHGTWFDHEELHRILRFVQSGGLEVARERQKERLVTEARRLREARQEAERSGPYAEAPRLTLLAIGVGAASDILQRILKR